MDFVIYILVFLSAIAILYIMTRIWIAFVDCLVDGIKKFFAKDDGSKNGEWHTLDEIRKR